MTFSYSVISTYSLWLVLLLLLVLNECQYYYYSGSGSNNSRIIKIVSRKIVVVVVINVVDNYDGWYYQSQYFPCSRCTRLENKSVPINHYNRLRAFISLPICTFMCVGVWEYITIAKSTAINVPLSSWTYPRNTKWRQHRRDLSNIWKHQHQNL